MKKILLANIGNRNLTIQDKKGDFLEVVPFISKHHLKNYIFLNAISLKEEFHFRNFTRDLLEELELGIKKPQDFKLQILTENEIISGKYHEVILFYTDQAPSKFDYQDTVFESELIKTLLTKLFPEVIFTLKLIKGNPTEFNNLYTQYAEIIKNLLLQNTENEYFLLDAGGTTQMKMASKAVFDYYAKQYHKVLNLRYVDHWSDNSYEVDRTLQSKYLLLDLASDYIRSFDLSAAQKTLERVLKLDPRASDLYEQTKVLNGRLRFEQKPVIAEFKEKVISPAPSFDSYVKGLLIPNTVSFLKETKNKKTVFEIASICQFYFIFEQYTLGIATFYRLSEEICQCFIEEKTGLNFSLSQDRDKFIENHTNGLQTSPLKSAKNIKYGLPTLLAYCYNKSNDNQPSIFAHLLKTCSIVNGKPTGLNKLRNQCWLAHENHAIRKENIENEVPDFFNTKGTLNTIFTLIGLPKENVFLTSQRELLQLFTQI